MKPRIKKNIPAMLSAVMAVAAAQTYAQSNAAYPTRPIHMVVPVPAAGPNDFVARAVGDYLSKSMGWVGLFSTGATPRDIVARISSDVAKAVRTPIVAARIRVASYEPGGSTPEQFAAKFRGDVARFSKIVKDIGVAPAD